MMTSRVLVHGRVVVSSLPVCDPNAALQPAVKRLLLERGELAQIHNADHPVRMIAYTELIAGRIRGNHYHRHKHEWMYIIRGSGRLVVEDRDTGARDETLIVAGDLVSIAVGVSHAIEPLEDGHAIEFSPSPFDPADTIAHTVI
jgi:mannose-6-phosphate isomerase-like protein (cupin superfamily)